MVLYTIKLAQNLDSSDRDSRQGIKFRYSKIKQKETNRSNQQTTYKLSYEIKFAEASFIHLKIFHKTTRHLQMGKNTTFPPLARRVPLAVYQIQYSRILAFDQSREWKSAGSAEASPWLSNGHIQQNTNPKEDAFLVQNFTIPPFWFQVLLTGSSACFSSFVHTTCTLSVFLSYLDLPATHLANSQWNPNHHYSKHPRNLIEKQLPTTLKW